MNLDTLKNRDYALLIDRSTSMLRPAQGGKSRWQAVQEVAYGLALKMSEFDPDGITVVPFSSTVDRHENVTPAKVDQIFTETEPNGSTALHLALKNELDNFFQRKAAGQLKPNGETIVVVTDGEPDDRQAVAKLIIDATNKLDRDEELAILFAQIGDDVAAADYLRSLDDDLQSKGAKFDIVDTRTFQEIGSTPLTQVLLNAITD